LKKWKGDILFLILVGALVAGWMSLYPNPGESPLVPLDPPAGLGAGSLLTYASADGITLAYRRYEPQGTPSHVVVLLHDTLLHSGWYERLAQDLAERGVAVYLPDRRGWGHSGGDRRQVAEDKSVLLDDITALIAVAQARTLQTEVYLAGHGRAAGLVLQYAAKPCPISGAILLSPYLSEDQVNLRPEGWDRFASAHPGEAFLARAGLSHWPVWRYNWPQSMVDADPLLETRCALACQQETLLTPEARGGADSEPLDLATLASPLQSASVPEQPPQEDSAETDSAPIALGVLYGTSKVPLLYVEAQDGPLFNPSTTPHVLASLSAVDRHLETCPGVDHLTLLEVAAEPIFAWLSSR
jgi:alpha-beta hydrolase superfamily lysophospholipase